MQTSSSLFKKPATPPSLKASWTDNYYCCGEDYGTKVFVENNTPSQHALSKITEYYCIPSSYAPDRHDLVHRYQPQYDSVRQQPYLRTDSLTWYYHKVGAYNWPCHFSMTSLRTAMNADGTPGCTDTLRATLSLLHLSPGQPTPEVLRQMVDLFHLPTAFPPVDEAFRQKYGKEE